MGGLTSFRAIGTGPLRCGTWGANGTVSVLAGMVRRHRTPLRRRTISLAYWHVCSIRILRFVRLPDHAGAQRRLRLRVRSILVQPLPAALSALPAAAADRARPRARNARGRPILSGGMESPAHDHRLVGSDDDLPDGFQAHGVGVPAGAVDLVGRGGGAQLRDTLRGGRPP